MFRNLSPEKKCDVLKAHFKRRHSQSILAIKDDFVSLKKTKKLPEEAVNKLKTWWHANITWPYPSDDDKEIFVQETRLDLTQISNWFINQRKRHWHKFFPHGLPQCKEDAEDYINRYNLRTRLHASSA